MSWTPVVAVLGVFAAAQWTPQQGRRCSAARRQRGQRPTSRGPAAPAAPCCGRPTAARPGSHGRWRTRQCWISDVAAIDEAVAFVLSIGSGDASRIDRRRGEVARAALERRRKGVDASACSALTS